MVGRPKIFDFRIFEFFGSGLWRGLRGVRGIKPHLQERSFRREMVEMGSAAAVGATLRGVSREEGSINLCEPVRDCKGALSVRGGALEKTLWDFEQAEAGVAAWRTRQAADGAARGGIRRTLVCRPCRPP